ncbi:hypothetical protein BJX62DRAFT_124783 [Aspergillus germanicus]
MSLKRCYHCSLLIVRFNHGIELARSITRKRDCDRQGLEAHARHDYVVFYSIFNFFNLYVCMTSRLPPAFGRAYAGLSSFELRLRSRRSFLRIHGNFAQLARFCFSYSFIPHGIAVDKDSERQALKSITRHGCDDVVVHLPVTTLIHQVVSLLQSRVRPLNGIQTMERNST